MCTLTFIPINDSQFLFTSNRDESAERAKATIPEVKEVADTMVLMPTDKQAGGTWIGASSKNRVVNLMNGAFERHKHEPPYRKSRGLVLLDCLTNTDIDNFLISYDLDNIEPFTMVVVDLLPGRKVVEMRWDGKRRFIEQIDPTKPFIWASTTLYVPEKRKQKIQHFQDWLKKEYDQSIESVIAFHRSEVIDDAYKRTLPPQAHVVHTLSITMIESINDGFQMHYYDLMEEEEAIVKLSLNVQ